MSESDTQEDDSETDTNQSEDSAPDPATAPAIKSFDVIPADSKGKLIFDISVESEKEIEKVVINTDAVSETIPVSETSFEETQTIEAEPGKINDVSTTVYTNGAGQEQASDKQYARAFTPTEIDAEIEYPFLYLLFWSTDDGHPSFEQTPGGGPTCAVGEPTMGWYSQKVDDFNQHNREAFETHFDQMLGHGLSSVKMNVGENDEERERLRLYQREIELFDEMTVYLCHPIIQAVRRDRDIWTDFEVFSEFFQEHDSVGTIDDRPVIYFYGFQSLYYDWRNEGLYERIVDNYGGLKPLVDEIRETFENNGINSFLIPDIGPLGEHWVREADIDEDYIRAASSADGVSHWTPTVNYEDDPGPEDWLEQAETRMQAIRQFAADHEIEYIPYVFPGFDDRDNECWGQDRYVEPSPELLERNLDLADKYRTTNVVFIGSWNEWAEGYALEPGTYQGEEFGTTYLELFKDRKSDRKEY